MSLYQTFVFTQELEKATMEMNEGVGQTTNADEIEK